jgi:predicted PurR-regulated permease PerM
LFELVTVVVFGFYFAGDGPNFFRTLATGCPHTPRRCSSTSRRSPSPRGAVTSSPRSFLAALSSFFHGIFSAVIGVPYWLRFALLVGITAQFIPMIGTYIGIALLVLATVFISPWKAIAIIAFATVYPQIESYFFTPRVSAKTMDVNLAIALAAVFVGGAIWGPLGALISIPLAAAGGGDPRHVQTLLRTRLGDLQLGRNLDHRRHVNLFHKPSAPRAEPRRRRTEPPART